MDRLTATRPRAPSMAEGQADRQNSMLGAIGDGWSERTILNEFRRRCAEASELYVLLVIVFRKTPPGSMESAACLLNFASSTYPPAISKWLNPCC